MGLLIVRYALKPLPIRPSPKYQVLLTGGPLGDCCTSPNLLANSSVNPTLSFWSPARPSCGRAFLLVLPPSTGDGNVLVPGTKESMRGLSETSNQTVPLLSTPIPEICTPQLEPGEQVGCGTAYSVTPLLVPLAA